MSTSGNFGAFVPTTEILNDLDDKELRLRLYQILNRLALSTNDKDIGIYPVTEFVNGQKYFSSQDRSSSQYQRQVFRKVIDFGALPNAGTKSVAHGITTQATYVFTRIYATATDPGATDVTGSIPLPYSSPTLNQNIALNIDNTNVNIVTAIDYSAYTECYVVLEYVKENT